MHTLHSLRLNTATKLAGFHNLISHAQRVSSTAKFQVEVRTELFSGPADSFKSSRLEED